MDRERRPADSSDRADYRIGQYDCLVANADGCATALYDNVVVDVAVFTDSDVPDDLSRGGDD